MGHLLSRFLEWGVATRRIAYVEPLHQDFSGEGGSTRPPEVAKRVVAMLTDSVDPTLTTPSPNGGTPTSAPPRTGYLWTRTPGSSTLRFTTRTAIHAEKRAGVE
jgi:hypothetical protein